MAVSAGHAVLISVSLSSAQLLFNGVDLELFCTFNGLAPTLAVSQCGRHIGETTNPQSLLCRQEAQSRHLLPWSPAADHYRFGPLGPALDPHEVFRLYVGGGKFQNIIGDLAPSNVDLPEGEGADLSVDQSVSKGHVPGSKGTEEAQRDARARQLAEVLLLKLDVYVAGDVEGFERAAWAEAAELRTEVSLIS